MFAYPIQHVLRVQAGQNIIKDDDVELGGAFERMFHFGHIADRADMKILLFERGLNYLARGSIVIDDQQVNPADAFESLFPNLFITVGNRCVVREIRLFLDRRLGHGRFYSFIPKNLLPRPAGRRGLPCRSVWPGPGKNPPGRHAKSETPGSTPGRSDWPWW